MNHWIQLTELLLTLASRLAEILPEAASVYRFDLRLVKESDGWRVTRAAWRPITLEQAVAGPELQP